MSLFLDACFCFRGAPWWWFCSTGDDLRDAEFSCSEVVVTVPHSALTCMVPPMFASALGPQKTDLDLRYTPIVHVANQFTGKSNATAAFASMRYLASTITNVSRVSMWGGFVTVNGTHLGPAGTAVSLQVRPWGTKSRLAGDCVFHGEGRRPTGLRLRARLV